MLLSINVRNNDNVYFDDTPIIENITSNSISIYCNNTAHLKAVCHNEEYKEIYELELKSKRATFTGLQPNCSYSLFTKNDTTVSRLVHVKTLNENNDLILDFKSYVSKNKNLLKEDLYSYEIVLNHINKNMLQDLEKCINNKQDEQLANKAKEIMYLAIKYYNEYIQTCNVDLYDAIPKKDSSVIYGNSMLFNNGVTKANVFINKNNKEYFEHSEPYPYSLNYLGKPNNLYSANTINDSFVRSPKYMFFNYSDNDKHLIKELFGHANILEDIDLGKYNAISSTKKYSNEILKCLAVIDNKLSELKLLKAPYASIINLNDLEINLNCQHLLPKKYNKYYLVVAKIDESLDTTPFRKIEIKDITASMIITNYESAINSVDNFCL